MRRNTDSERNKLGRGCFCLFVARRGVKEETSRTRGFDRTDDGDRTMIVTVTETGRRKRARPRAGFQDYQDHTRDQRSKGGL